MSATATAGSGNSLPERSGSGRAGKELTDPARPDVNRIHFVPGTVGPEIIGGDGCWLLTADGRRILDGAGGAIVANIGHGRIEIADAVRDAMAGGLDVDAFVTVLHAESIGTSGAEVEAPRTKLRRPSRRARGRARS